VPKAPQEPPKPGEMSTHADLTALLYCKASSDHCHVALLEIAKSAQRGEILHFSPNHFPGVPTLLHGHLRYARQRPSVLA
jgi:hypothetical protein